MVEGDKDTVEDTTINCEFALAEYKAKRNLTMNPDECKLKLCDK